VFNWSFSPESSVQAPPEFLLVFKVPGDMFLGGGIIRKVQDAELATVPGTTKAYLYVDNIETAMEVNPKNFNLFFFNLFLFFCIGLLPSYANFVIKLIVKNGGKKISEKESEGDKAFYQFFEDSEGNGQAIYSYAK
jgi:hypothetical protein